MITMASKNKAKPGAVAQPPEYAGLLGELPPVYPAMVDPNRPPPPAVAWLGRVVAKLDGAEIAKRWRQQVLTAKTELLEHEKQCWGLLAEGFGIDLSDPGAWFQMARALARRHVPAFQIERAMEKARARRAKKPIKLNHAGTACLFLWSELEKVKKRRPLQKDETEVLQIVRGEIAVRGLKEKTIRSLKKQMREAMADYWLGKATDFQRQYVEEVLPMIGEALKQPPGSVEVAS